MDLHNNRTLPVTLTPNCWSILQQPLTLHLVFNLRLPRNTEPCNHQTRNSSIATSCFCCKLPKHVLTPHAIAFDPWKRTRGACLRHHPQALGLGCGYLPAHASFWWPYSYWRAVVCLLAYWLLESLFFFCFAISYRTDSHSLDKLDKHSWLDRVVDLYIFGIWFWFLLSWRLLCLWVFGLCRALYPWPRDVSFQTWRSLIDRIYYFCFLIDSHCKIPSSQTNQVYWDQALISNLLYVAASAGNIRYTG